MKFTPTREIVQQFVRTASKYNAGAGVHEVAASLRRHAAQNDGNTLSQADIQCSKLLTLPLILLPNPCSVSLTVIPTQGSTSRLQKVHVLQAMICLMSRTISFWNTLS